VDVASADGELIPVVSYARISADQKKDEHGVADQRKINRRTAAHHGWTVVHEFTDNDKSAAKADVVRDDFEEMLRVIRAGKLSDGTPVQGVVVMADDRLARRPGDYERFVEAITHQDGRVYSDARGPKDLYSEDVESMGLFGAVISKMEVRKMQRRMRNSHRQRGEAGIPVGGARPFGWQADRLTLDPAEASWLERAALDVLGGRSLHSIVREWQADGLRTSVGNDWSARSLKLALCNPRMCGYRELGGELVRGGDGEPVVGQWAPILTPEQWQAIRAIFEARQGHFVGRDLAVGSAHSADYRDPAYLLSAIARCGNILPDGTRCNTPVRCNKKKGAPCHTYVCRSKAEGGCGGVSRRGDFVDMFVSEAVLAKLEEAQFAPPDAEEWEGEAEYAAVQEQLNELTAQWNAQKISNELFFKLAPAKETEVHRLRAEKARHDAARATHQAEADTTIAEIRWRWYLPDDDGGLAISVKRTYIRKALHTVIIHPAGKGNKKFDPDLLELIWRED
jgi:DNA invertase Pin-like site-specific DNA recombinase